MASRDDYFFFWRGPLSQWHPVKFTLHGRDFVCAEQYMMFCKARLFNDTETAFKILATKSAREHKTLGRQVKAFDEDTWRLLREGIVFTGNLAKFSQNEALKQVILGSGQKTIVEASPRDTVWGVGLAENNNQILDPLKWRGLNLLGDILMRVRSCLAYS